MTLRHRSMTAKDVPVCAAIIAKHPVLGPRYQGRAMEDLCAAWKPLLGLEPLKVAIFEESLGSRFEFRGFGMNVFVTDEFVRELKTAPIS